MMIFERFTVIMNNKKRNKLFNRNAEIMNDIEM